MTVPPVRAPSWRRSRPRRNAAWTLGRVGLCAALLGFAGWEGTLSRNAAEAHESVLFAIACALLGAAIVGRGLQRKASLHWLGDGLGAIGGDLTRRTRRAMPVVAGVWIWTALVLVTIGWDLFSFSREAPSLPTLSRLIGDVTEHDWGRALLFAGWLAIGAYLAMGLRRGRGRGRAEEPTV